MPETCETCRYWIKGSVHRECRRHAPRMDDETTVALWPVTAAQDGCGEHEPIPLGKGHKVESVRFEEPKGVEFIWSELKRASYQTKGNSVTIPHKGKVS